MWKRTLLIATLASCSGGEHVSTLADGDAAVDESVMLFRLSEDVFKTAGHRDFEEPVEISRWLNGTYVRGSGTSHIWTDFETAADATAARLDTLTYSETNTQTSGSQDGVSFCFNNAVSTGSRTSLRISAERGAWLEPSRSNVGVDIRLSCVNVGNRLFPRIAERRARREINSRIPTSERIVFNETHQQTNQRLDEEAAAKLDDPGIAQLEKMRTDFIAAGFAHRLGITTSDDAFRMTIAHDGEVPSRPALPMEADVTIAFHENMMNDFLGREFAGKTMTQEEFDAKFRDMMGALISQPDAEEPDSGDGGEGEQVPSLTFAAENPITFTMTPSRVTLTIRGDAWVTPNNTYDKKMDIIAVYNKIDGPNGVELQREESLTVIPRGWTAGDGALPIRTQIIAGALKAQFNQKIQMSMVETNLTLEGYLSGAGDMKLANADAADGWLVLGYKAD